ncbi:hypothetical protein V6U77_10045 [Micromonospora sp. CPCC 205546]
MTFRVHYVAPPGWLTAQDPSGDYWTPLGTTADPRGGTAPSRGRT